MGDRGRKSAADLSVAASNVVTLTKRPEPADGLSEREGEIWQKIVESLPVDWFSPGDLPLLVAYVRAIALHERVSEEAAHAEFTIRGAQGGEVVNPIFKIQDMAARQMASLAVKLRLSQSAKWTEQKAATKSAKAKTARPWEN